DLHCIMPPDADPARRLAQIAHELNNPLAAILAFTQDLLQADPSPEQREALQVIAEQARRARQLVQGLLAEARTDATAAPVVVHPRELADRVRRVFDRLCRERGQTLVFSAPETLPPIEGNGVALEQALGNLLQNASQATPPGGAVALTCRQRGRLVEFVVRDTGAGIPAEHLASIFTPFFTTKGAGEGTGLGLSVAQEIVHRHRGTLMAENVPDAEGGGAQFVIAIPFDRRTRERDPGRVLLVEDDADLRRALARYLARRGWTVEEASDGAAAIEALGRGGYDVVVSDARLPGTTGMTLHDQMTPGPRFVLISGDAGSPEIEAFRERTGVAVLQKPFELEALAAAVRGRDRAG
ncbi:MAG TPA: ATP-binding protein, partial [Gemmatimonadales bacterium]